MGDLVDMEMDDEDKLDAIMPIKMSDKPEYPYGLTISLTDKEFDKLGLDPTSGILGGFVTGNFVGKVTHMSISKSDGGDGCCRCEIQIQQLCIDCDDDK